ncbi:MAG: hypothetical protein NTW29_03380 [Bacteroidetes bacterium]|nr:hypothetical protein [Bacteroidota bacterium]
MKKNLIFFLLLSSMEVAAQNVGIGNRAPVYPLDISGRLRIRGGANENFSSGIWFSGTGADSAQIKAFWGMRQDTVMGAYGEGTGWSFLMDYRTGHIGLKGNTPDPAVPITMGASTGDKISFYRDVISGNNYGIGIGSSTLQLITPGIGNNIVLGYGRSNSFTEVMRVSGFGGVSIGTTNTAKAGLTVNTKAGAVHALFGSNTTGVAIESSFPGIGFNTYYNGSRLAIANGFGGYIGVNPIVGGMQLGVSSVSKNADENITVNTAIDIKPNGDIGIGVPDAAYKLDLGGRFRIRATPGFTAGMWLNNDANTSSNAFIGMQTDNQVGFFGNGTGWSFLMNTTTGAVSFGGAEGVAGQVLTSSGSAGAPVWKTPGDGKPFVVRPTVNSPDLGTSGQVDIPNMVANFTLTEPSQVVFNYKISIFNRGCVACGDRRTFVELYQNIIGGTIRIATATVYTPNAQFADAVSGPIVLDLPAGTYSYKLLLTASTVYGTATVFARQAEGIMTWQIFPN